MAGSTPKNSTQKAFEAFTRELQTLAKEVNKQRKLVQQQVIPNHELPDALVPAAYEQALAELTNHVARVCGPEGSGFSYRGARYLLRGVEVELVRAQKALGKDQPITAVVVRGFIKQAGGGQPGNYSSQSSSSR